MGFEGQVGINYANNDAGAQDFTRYQTRLEGLVDELTTLRTNSVDEWTGEDEAAYQQVMAFAKNESAKMQSNMGNLSSWTTTSGAVHKACEKKNASNIINAYASLS